MPNMTLSIPADLHETIKRHPHISWSAVARDALRSYARRLELLDALTQDSDLTEEDLEELGKKIKASIRRRHEAGS